VLFLEKRADSGKPGLGILINKDWHNPRHVDRGEIPGDFGNYKKMLKIFDETSKPVSNTGNIDLSASEIVLFM